MSAKNKIQKMKQSIKKRWVAALRSGKYLQGTGALKDKEGRDSYYCCLGVLCLQKDSPQKPSRYEGGLSQKASEWSGLSEVVENKLIQFNDKEGWSFKRIAAYIDRYL